MPCDILKAYGDECAARVTVKCIEALSRNMPCSIEEACSILNITRNEYDAAKAILEE